MTARDLDAKSFPPVQWVVPDLIPEGLTIFAGKPKLGKSFAALDVAIAVATGGYAFASVQCSAGDVLYGAFEDSERRLKQRVGAIYRWREKPDRLALETQPLRVGEGLEVALTAWVQRVESPRLVIIDTLRCVRPAEDQSQSAYGADAAALAPVLDLCRGTPGLGIIVVHHVRKMDAEDPFDTISGTHGLTGVADTLMVLARSGNRVTLTAKGRDLDDYAKAMERDRSSGSWRIAGDAAELAKTAERQAILDALRNSEEPLGAADIAREADLKTANVQRTLNRMARAGEIMKAARGRYTCPNGPNGPNGSESVQFRDLDNAED